MTDDNFNEFGESGEKNVLKYIYMLDEHLNNLTLMWQGLSYNAEGELIRISEPFACDMFIYTQINALRSVLNAHTFVSNVNHQERNHIILDTYASFLWSMNREPTVEYHRKPTLRESFFNTLLLFLNIVKDGSGAEFTLGAQSGITTDIYRHQRQKELKPLFDVPKAFGFRKNNINPKQPSHSEYLSKNSMEENYNE
ncbi:MAG: hypothetical protein R6V14_01520 [Halanaerobiales bacterium]